MISKVPPPPVAEHHGESGAPPCTPEQRVTRALLGYGIVAGPFYVAVSLTQAALRDGFDLTRHPWSLLANGPAGWVQIANLILTGLMVTAAAVGYPAPSAAGSAGVGCPSFSPRTARPDRGRGVPQPTRWTAFRSAPRPGRRSSPPSPPCCTSSSAGSDSWP